MKDILTSICPDCGSLLEERAIWGEEGDAGVRFARISQCNKCHLNWREIYEEDEEGNITILNPIERFFFG